ncbi:T9SS sorting signal type C domain-containing protein [Flavobacterium sp. WG21]|uniref:T9SS sorting signal type C domain-containing protein n=1 Tax=Flavobacterium sp. WG21 TaxID=1229487 RepID=UPI00034BC081|nr:T9SS sorting signal type C domain-containing protein [Flavobacterium sp. WG21]
MKRTLLSKILFFPFNFLLEIKNVFGSSKLYFKAFFTFIFLISINNLNAQCNSGATAGPIESNTDKLCVGVSATFWSTGWKGTWSSSNSAILEVSTDSDGRAIVTAKAPGVANVINTVTQSNCSVIKTAQKQVTVYEALGATGIISGANPQCTGNTGQVYSIPPVANATKYVWNVPSGWTITSGANTNSITVTVGSGADNITVVVSNDCKTNNAAYKYVNITDQKTPRPTITASGTTTFCQGGSVTLTSTKQDKYLWSNGETGQSINVTTSGTYTVTTTKDGYNCPSNASNSIAVNVQSGLTFSNQPQDLVACEGQSGTFSVTASASNATYQWQYSANGSTNWTNTNGVQGVSGHNTATLNLTNLPLSYSDYYVRCVARSSTTCPANTNTNSNTAKLTVNPSLKITSQSTATQTKCLNDAFTPLTVTATASGTVTYQWFSNTAASTTNGTALGASNGARTSSYTPQSTTSGTLYYYAVVTSSCGTATTAISEAMITKQANIAPTVGTIKQPTCTTPSGSVVLENVPASGRLLESRGTVYNYTTSGTTYEISGLAPGTYKFAIDDNCTRVYSSDIVILPGNVWNGTKWSGGTPSLNDPIQFTGNYTAETDLNGCSCTIDNGATVTIKSGVTLTIANSIDVNSGSLVFENSSNLIQKSNAKNTGSISYIRTSPPIFQKDYLYWSTPVTPQKLVDVSPSTPANFYYGNDGTQWVRTNRESNMIVGKGYIIRGPSNYTNTNKQEFTATFKGIPNNGDLEGESLTATKAHLIGNPYPSALSADMLLKENPMLNGTLYFWTHNTPAKPVASNQYSADDYASYNLSGGVSAKSDKQHNNDPAKDKGTKPTGNIAAGQAFFVTTNAAGKVKFNNSMRLGGSNNGQFFRPGNTSKVAALEKHRIWLNMTNATGAFKQLLVSYIEGATNDFESNYDGLTFDGNQYLDFYTTDQKNKYVIQGRALPFTDADLVPLGYRTTVAGDFTVAIDEVDGNMSHQTIYIEDKTTGTVHDLTQSNYTFKTEAGTFTERLTLRYKPGKTLGTGDFENIENGILISTRNKTIQVSSSKENIEQVVVFDITGKQLYSKNKLNSAAFQIENLPSANQVLLVKVTLANDFTVTRKVLLQ